jgi:hypothetical protein
MAKDEEIDVIARKISLAKFTVPAGTRPEIENTIEEKLRSKDIVWDSGSDGINVVCISQDKQNVWRPRKRFNEPKNSEE